VKLEVVRNRYFTDMNRGPLFRRPWGMANISEYTPERRSPAPFRCTNGRARATRRPGFTALAVLHGTAGAAIFGAKVVKDGRRD